MRAAACGTCYRRLPHPVPPADLLPALLADPVTRAGAVPCIDLDPGTARSLAADPDYQVREQLAQHPGLPAQLRDLLAEDPSLHVRLRVFARQDSPAGQRAAIHDQIMADARPPHQPSPGKDPDDETAILQLLNDLAPLQLRMLRLPWVTAVAAVDALGDRGVYLVLGVEGHGDADVAVLVVQQPGDWRPADTFPLPPATLRRLAADPDPRMRVLAPRDPDLPAELAALLAADPDARVRHAIASHPRLPTRNLLALLADPSEPVADAAAASPSLPLGHMHQILGLANL